MNKRVKERKALIQSLKEAMGNGQYQPIEQITQAINTAQINGESVKLAQVKKAISTLVDVGEVDFIQLTNDKRKKHFALISAYQNMQEEKEKVCNTLKNRGLTSVQGHPTEATITLSLANAQVIAELLPERSIKDTIESIPVYNQKLKQ